MTYHVANSAKGEVIMFGGAENSNTEVLADGSSSSEASFFDVTAVSGWVVTLCARTMLPSVCLRLDVQHCTCSEHSSQTVPRSIVSHGVEAREHPSALIFSLSCYTRRILVTSCCISCFLVLVQSMGLGRSTETLPGSQDELPAVFVKIPPAMSNLQKNFTIPTVTTWYEDSCTTASELPSLDKVLYLCTVIRVNMTSSVVDR